MVASENHAGFIENLLKLNPNRELNYKIQLIASYWRL